MFLKTLSRLVFTAIFLMGLSNSYSQDNFGNSEVPQMIKQVKATSVKDQAQSGTCWVFATISFLESELIRMGKPEYDLSEMYFVRNTYPVKADVFIRYQGKHQFSEGGQAHDVLNTIRQSGIVPESAYSGLKGGQAKINHNEMDNMINATVGSVVKKIADNPGSAWKDAVSSILDVYLGKNVESFTVNGKNYTPRTFAAELNLNLNDYVELTSFNHHPFYTRFCLEIPDNWSSDQYYNLPLDDLIAVMDNALKNGYSITWDGDVSENGFSQADGFALLKDESIKIDQDTRQKEFDNFKTTDDHLIHITGLANDKNGKKYYFTKNSWGIMGRFNGFIYLSEQYVKMKTIAILVHKNAIPKEIADKLGKI